MEKTKAWDATLRALTHLGPAAIDRFAVPGVTFEQELPGKVQNIQRDADAVHKVLYGGQSIILHLEFQTYNDDTMPDRLLLYNVLLRQAYTLPVLSCVIYLLNDGKVQSSPFEQKLPGGQSLLTFHFESIEISKPSAEDLIQQGDETLLALVPLTRNGTRRDILESVFRELERRKALTAETERISEIGLITFTLASFAFAQREDIVEQEWLTRRYREMSDALEDTVIFKEMTRRAEEKGQQRGLERGRELGLEQGRIDGSRRSLQLFVQSRFPAIVTLTQEKTSQIDDIEVLDVMLVSLFSAQTEDEARAILQRINTSQA